MINDGRKGYYAKPDSQLEQMQADLSYPIPDEASLQSWVDMSWHLCYNSKNWETGFFEMVQEMIQTMIMNRIE